MLKLRFIAFVVLLGLLISCVPVESGTPTISTIIPATTIVLPTGTSSPTTAPLPRDKVVGLIAYASDLDGDFEIWVMNIDGSDQRKLTDNDATDLSPAWSPDGNQIAFVSNRDGNDEIYVMDADGNHVQRLTQTDAAGESFPAWSPDGSMISFDSDRGGNWDICVMASDGSNPRRLTDHPAEDWISSWSPDGKQIVFESNRDGNYEIYAMDSDGSNLRRLTDNQTQDGFPAWSPDGEQIAYLSQQGGNYDIYVISSAGTNRQQVTDNPAQDSDPAWSPDGEWLAFVSQRDGNDEIWLVNVDGGNLHQLTDTTAQNWAPAWQPAVKAAGSSNTWIRTFEGPEYGAFFDLALTPDGNFITVGTTNHLHVPPYSGDALFIKLNLAGERIWEQTWGGAGYEQAWSILPGAEGGFYIFGETDSYGAGDRDFFLLKITGDGSEEWFQTYGMARREWPYGMLQLSNGDLLIYGFTTTLVGGGRNQYALRLDPDGNVIWEYVGDSPDDEFILDALETTAGNLVLAVGVAEDGELVELDAGGNLLWAQRYELAGWQFASQIAPTDDGGYLLAGFSMSEASPRQADTWLARTSATGELAWETSFGDPVFDDYANSMIRLNDGTYLTGAIGNGMLLSRIDENGNILWRRSLVGQTVYGAMALLELEDGGCLVAGLIQLVNGRSYDAILLRTDAQGLVGE